MRGRPLHHVALVPRDHTTSLRLYCDGLGLRELLDAKSLKGAWPHLFDAPNGTLRSIFLGSPEHGNAGVVELLLFSDDIDAAARRRAPTARVNGLFLLSFYVGDVEATLADYGIWASTGTPRPQPWRRGSCLHRRDGPRSRRHTDRTRRNAT